MRRGGSTVVIGAILSIMLLLPFATGQAFAQQEVHRKAIDNAYREWVDATNARDLNRWASFLAPDPLFLPPKWGRGGSTVASTRPKSPLLTGQADGLR